MGVDAFIFVYNMSYNSERNVQEAWRLQWA